MPKGTPHLTFPTWQAQVLSTLAKQNKLTGVTPIQLGAILQGEGPKSGGLGINKTGYGGWFGLGANTPYGPSKKVVPSNVMVTPSQAAFAQQAEVAAAAFATYLKAAGGNPVYAAQMFQTGSISAPNGLANDAKIMQTVTTGTVAQATQSGWRLIPLGPGLIPIPFPTSGGSPPGQTGGGNTGAPYTPSSVPGVPATPPKFPDFTKTPMSELSRVAAWATEFGAWGLFTMIVLLFGILLMALGLIMLILLFTRPVAEPVGKGILGFTALGKVNKIGKLASGAGAVGKAKKVAGGGGNPAPFPRQPGNKGARTSPAKRPSTAGERNARMVSELSPAYLKQQRERREQYGLSGGGGGQQSRTQAAGSRSRSIDHRPSEPSRRGTPMSTSRPKGNERRRQNYERQSPGRPLTPAQSKRIRQKGNRETAGRKGRSLR